MEFTAICPPPPPPLWVFASVVMVGVIAGTCGLWLIRRGQQMNAWRFARPASPAWSVALQKTGAALLLLVALSASVVVADLLVR